MQSADSVAPLLLSGPGKHLHRVTNCCSRKVKGPGGKGVGATPRAVGIDTLKALGAQVQAPVEGVEPVAAAVQGVEVEEAQPLPVVALATVPPAARAGGGSGEVCPSGLMWSPCLCLSIAPQCWLRLTVTR